MSKFETLSDIIAEKRRLAEHIRKNLSTVPVRRWDQEAEIKSLEDEANRLEAVLGREKSTAEKSSAVGDAAKLREALVSAIGTLKKLYAPGKRTAGRIVACRQKCEAALAAPPRNCDKFQTKEDAAMAFNKERGVFIPQSILWQLGEWLDWLFAHATEQKGNGDAD